MEQIFDSNHPVNVEIEPEPIVEFSPELEQKIDEGEMVKLIEPKRTILCGQCGEQVNCKDEKYDKRVMGMHKNNKVLCKGIKKAPII